MDLALKVGNKIYKGWENIRINKSMTSICHTFDMDIKTSQGIELDQNSLVTILKDGFVFLTGYVDFLEISIEDTQQPMRIAGRSKTADLVDCMIVENHEYSGQNALQIISHMIQNFDIGIYTDIDLEVVETFTTKVGETYFNAINRLCKQQNILPISDEFGDILLTINRKNISDIVLQSFTSFRFSFDSSSRYSEYIYKQESSLDDVADQKLIDPIYDRYRPFVDINNEENKSNNEMCKWKNNSDKARSFNLDVSIVGWDIDINSVIKIEAPFASGFWLVLDVDYSKSDNGSVSNLILCDKDLFDVSAD